MKSVVLAEKPSVARDIARVLHCSQKQYVILENMTNEERKIYDMVVRRFLAVLSEPCVYEEVSVEGQAAGETFFSRGEIMKSPGWEIIMSTTRTATAWSARPGAGYTRWETPCACAWSA